MAKIDVKGTPVTVISGGTDDYISLTYGFNPIEFDGIKRQAEETKP